MQTVDELAREVSARAGGPEPLQQLTAAVLTAEQLRDLADDLLDRYVAAAREAGRSWAEIGTVLGVTKQAAQQRFVASAPTELDDGARALLPAAERHARSFRHRYIGTEHVLLALTEDDGLAGATLRGLGVDAESVRTRIVAIVGEGHSSTTGALGITPRTKRMLEGARRESRRLGHRCDTAAPEHVLLALGGARGGVAVQILGDLGIGEDRLRRQLSELLSGEDAELAAAILRPPRRRALRGRH